MYRIRFISSMVTMLLIGNLCIAAIKPVIVFKADKTQTVIGGLVTLIIQVKGTGIKYVSWNLFDNAITNIDKVDVLQTDIPGNGIQSLKHIIVFTSAKPGNIIIDHLPVVIHYPEGNYAFFTNKSVIKFKNEPLISNINDINSIVETAFFPLKYLLYFALFFTITLTAYLAGNIFLKKNKRELKISPQNIRQVAFEKLELLESQMIKTLETNNHMGDMIFDVLKDFLDHTFMSTQFTGNEDELLKNINSLRLENRDKQLIIDILNTSLNTRFSIRNNSSSITVYMNKVKDFISSLALPPIIEV